MSKYWVREQDVPVANRFEIRVGGWQTAPYGMELIQSQHNNPFSVKVELARMRFIAKKDAVAWPELARYAEARTTYVIEREEHVDVVNRSQYPVQVVDHVVWAKVRREFAGSFRQFGNPRPMTLVSFCDQSE